MKIDTDRVKNKKYANPIESSIQKYAQEYRVLATLKYLFPEKFKTMIAKDNPDLQDVANRVGIEVTVAAGQNDMKAFSLFSKMRNATGKAREKQIRKIISCGYFFTRVKDNRFVISTFGTSDCEKSLFRKSIQAKTEKSQKYRNSFDTVGVAILLLQIPTREAEENYVDWTKETLCEDKTSFDFVYIISNRFCILYDVKNDYSDKRSISPEENRLLCIIGRMSAEKELSLEDVEWK